MSDDEKVKIVQDPKVAIQIATALAKHEGSLSVIINMPMMANVSGERQNVIDPTVGPIDILELIRRFPEPRLKNFIEHLYYLAEEKFGNKVLAAAWLGVNPRTLYRHSVPTEKEFRDGSKTIYHNGSHELPESIKTDHPEVDS